MTDQELEKGAARYNDAWDHCDAGVSLSYEQVAGLLETIQSQREALEQIVGLGDHTAVDGPLVRGELPDPETAIRRATEIARKALAQEGS